MALWLSVIGCMYRFVIHSVVIECSLSLNRFVFHDVLGYVSQVCV